MPESRTSKIRSTLYTVLSDGQARSFQELLEIVISVDRDLLTSPNMLSSILSRMIKADTRMIRPKRGYFQFVPINVDELLEYLTPEDLEKLMDDSSFVSEDDSVSVTARQMCDEEEHDMSLEPLQGHPSDVPSATGMRLLAELPIAPLHDMLTAIEHHIKLPDYEMEEAEFRANKKLYMIKNHLQEILLLCSELCGD